MSCCLVKNTTFFLTSKAVKCSDIKVGCAFTTKMICPDVIKISSGFLLKNVEQRSLARQRSRFGLASLIANNTIEKCATNTAGTSPDD